MMRVATMTIVVFFEDSSIGELARVRIGALATKHPSRVVLLDGTRDEEYRVERDDWIELGVRGENADEVRAAVAAQQISDAPVVLLWIAPGIGDDPRFVALSAGAQTIVYNSSLIDVGGGALCRLVEYVEEHPDLPVADISYLRLAPWQESVAMLFDGEDSHELLNVCDVEIACGSEPEALYLLGWLASRLGWQPRSDSTLVGPSGREITFTMRREGEPRRIRRVALTSTHSRFVAEVGDDGETIALSATGTHAHPHRYRAIGNPGIAALVERAILSGHNDRIFRESLAVAGVFLRCGGGRS